MACEYINGAPGRLSFASVLPLLCTHADERLALRAHCSSDSPSSSLSHVQLVDHHSSRTPRTRGARAREQAAASDVVWSVAAPASESCARAASTCDRAASIPAKPRAPAAGRLELYCAGARRAVGWSCFRAVSNKKFACFYSIWFIRCMVVASS